MSDSYGYANNILRDFIQSVLSIEGLSEKLAAGQDQLIKDRISIMDLTRSLLNMVVLDADGETYTKHASSVAGIADIIDRNQVAVAGVSNYPVTKLFGRSPGGENATGESDQTNYYDWLQSMQKSRYHGPVTWALRLAALSRNLNPDDYRVKWKPLWTPTEAETVEARSKQAQTDQAYVLMGALSADEVRQSRFGGDHYSIETELQAVDDSAPSDEEVEAYQRALAERQQGTADA